MTRTALCLGACVLLACDGGGEAPRARADAVDAPSGQATLAGTGAGAGAQTSSAPRAPRKICQRAPKGAGKKPADVKLDHVEAEGEAALAETLTTGDGKWTWVNLWAGWCGPCKEEMPLLKEWQTKLASKLRIAFVSIDDDERLSKRFLNEQPKAGVRQSHFLKSQDSRKEWLTSVGIENVAKLPVHVLLDPSGAVSCVIEGAVDAADFAQVEAIVSKP